MRGGVTASRRPPSEVRFYFSYRSPYSWLATVRLAQLIPLPVPVVLQPVWEPEVELRERLTRAGLVWDFAQPSRQKRRYIFQDIRRFADAWGLSMKWPIDRNPRWSRPHVGFLYARAHGRERQYHAEVYRRRFVDGEDVTDLRVLASIAATVGLNGGDFVSAIDGDGYRGQVLACFHEADENCVFGWPFFVYGPHKFWGNDRLDWLVSQVRADHPEDVRARHA